MSTTQFFEVDLKQLHQKIVHKRNRDDAKLVEKELVIVLGIEAKKQIIIVNVEGIPMIPS